MPQPYPFDETIAHLDEIDQWLHGRGLQAHDRIRKYRKNIRDMIELQGWDENLETLQNIAEGRRREIFWSYVQPHLSNHYLNLKFTVGLRDKLYPTNTEMPGKEMRIVSEKPT
jgi:hypothetical protein